jgi:hypothetical protein
MCCLKGGLLDLVDRFGGLVVSTGFQQADLLNDFVDLGWTRLIHRENKLPAMLVTHPNFEVLAEPDVICYTIEACAGKVFSGYATRNYGNRPLTERTLSTS